IFLHGVALLSGIGTPSLTAQGGQRRPLQSFNRDRDIPGDEALIAAYNAGDLYTGLAEVLFGRAESRPIAKRVFLAFLYGMSAERIASLLAGVEGSDADRELYTRKIDAFFNAYPGLASYRAIQQKNLLEEGFVSSLYGNRRVRSQQGMLSQKENRWALNHPVQSTASLIFKESLLEIAREFEAEQIILPVHDAVLLQLHNDDTFDRRVERASELMIQAFNRRIPTVRARVTAGSFIE
ncbi:DNA polymerase, partial [Aurantimonas sp. E1-2-R+4]|uniref:DNA polymerase n=1 Tax=Aurantimonas sp. E1-2-R+4 TaxID=3113714 RepID=UPI002F92B4C3